jgi:DNA polymerase III delta prime subunit
MLRVILEKYRQTTIFIVITSKYDSVIDPIRSRFLCIRFPRIKDKVKRKILYQEIKPPKISEKYYDFIYTLEDKNEIELSFEVKKEIESYIDPHLITSRRIIKIYEKNKITKKYYEDLKNLSYHVIKFNLEIPKFYKIFLSELLKKQSIRDKQKFKLIQLFADSEYNYNKSYRSIIVLESLLFNVYNLCY